MRHAWSPMPLGIAVAGSPAPLAAGAGAGPAHSSAAPRCLGPRQGDGEVFPAGALAGFAAAYPETPHRLAHRFAEHPLLTLAALARLGEALPAGSIEHNRGDLPLGVEGKPPGNGLAIGETIRAIATCGSWAVLKNVEQDPAYAALLTALLAELRPAIAARTGPPLRPQGYVFVSSPGAVTPYHFDPEHNLLVQLRGSKLVTVFPAGDPRCAADQAHEDYHAGGGRELAWRAELAGLGEPFRLDPGDALYLPVMAPHHVRNGAAVSISLSLTWRSEWSFAEADARGFNAVLRGLGLAPRAPGRWPAGNRAKAYAWRLLGRASGRR